MKRDLQYLAELESYNSGKVLKDAIFDVYASIYALEYYAGWADKIHGQQIPAGNYFLLFAYDFPLFHSILLFSVVFFLLLFHFSQM